MVNIFSDILKARLSRRSALKISAGVAAAGSLTSLPLAAMGKHPQGKSSAFSLDFTSIAKDYTDGLTVTNGYKAQVLVSWGDAVLSSVGKFQPHNQTAENQAKLFGYNNDFTAYLPINGSSSHGLLHVNHEYTNAHLMFSGVKKKNSSYTITPEQLRIEQAAQGFSTLEVKLSNAAQWQVVENSKYARRVTANTPIKISGPAAGSKRLQTAADPTGKLVLGTFANCAGGVTPWGTVLTCEENFDGYFKHKTKTSERANHKRYTVSKKLYYGWYRIDDRFDVKKTPNEPNRFGWVVEYDPKDPNSQPVKRTALGRFKHETATCTTSPDGRLVVYSGDDDYFEYIYRFVSTDKINTEDRQANKDLLDNGTLYVAKFNADGTLNWLPLIYGQGPLTDINGFYSQADVLIETRRAGDVLGATKMDRPEGIAISPKTGEIYVSLTRNPKRDYPNIANPRIKNEGGHIIKMAAPNADHAADKFNWDIDILAGNPEHDNPDYNGRINKSGWFSSPDNLAFHPSGSLWIATDGMQGSYGFAEGLYATDKNTKPKCFLRAPRGAEVTGPCFTPDGQTLFLSIQHPGDDKGSTFDEPSTRWPDFKDNMPPRPSVLAISKA